MITTGVSYRQLEQESIEKFNGQGVYYGAAMTEARACEQQRVFIVGGGNSAGQAAMYLSQYAKQVIILIRSESLKTSMSQYLIDQLEATHNVEIWPFTEVKGATGEDKLEKLQLYHNKEDRDWDEEALGFVCIYWC